MDKQQIEQLRQALEASPDNDMIRRMLANALLTNADFEGAEQEFRALRARIAGDIEIDSGMVKAMVGLGRNEDALLLIESLPLGVQMSPDIQEINFKLLKADGRVPEAIDAYKRMIEDFPDRKDEDFEMQFGVGLAPDADSDVVDGHMRGLDDDMSAMIAELEKPQITFADVGGMDDLKDEIRLKIIEPIKNPELYKAYGKKAGGGILMYGAPGCGKTYLAKATAGEARLAFISVGIHDILDMWIGNSERNLHELFEMARRNAPAILFFDEVDALGASRSDMRQSGSRHLVNQFLAEMDGTNGNNEGLLILAATNAPWHVDTAFRRPGRFDRVLFVPPPDQEAREQILELKLREKPVDEHIDLKALAAKCPGFSGADMDALIEMAIEAKLKASLKSGMLEKLTQKDLLKAAKKHKPTTKEWFASAKNHAVYSNQGGVYDEILNYLKIK